MDALIEAAKQRKRPRDIAIFLVLRYTGMRRASVASLRMSHLDADWACETLIDDSNQLPEVFRAHFAGLEEQHHPPGSPFVRASAAGRSILPGLA